ncbi:hypothetical protein AXG93_2471s1140 [Marchantia polymorpha subsp. ruderalis]|uniref:Reverse transcriptase/retrotransposon-derived protein RNase H-like domain-containing protein n=1 Tax=Marchantia polymorpha subsp. ruderalis TaxID=1480154 RepID=A0A176W3H4_MARPO|nr:hypothetical protein AXG93_2471s1140 [Marchantia polymorpha subsp. ruderalis]
MTSGILLGHRVSADGIAVDIEKVKVILELEPPTNLRELRAFLGHVGYYRRFIHLYAILAADLTKLLKKDEPYAWGANQQSAFEALKAKLTTAPVLRSPDWNRPFHVYVDTSAFAIGVVLSQKDDNKKDYPIYFASRQLSLAERKYTTTEREALGMDFRKLNAATRKDHHPLPFTDAILDHVAGHECYSFLDGFLCYSTLCVPLSLWVRPFYHYIAVLAFSGLLQNKSNVDLSDRLKIEKFQGPESHVFISSQRQKSF